MIYSIMLKIHFKYDLEKDVENFLRGTQSINNKTPTKLQRLYIEKHGTIYNSEIVRNFIETYVQNNHIDLSSFVTSIEHNWRLIEENFIYKIEKLFGTMYPTESITAYLSTNSRCTYNVQDNYFFVFLNAKSPNAYIIHELFHFYTWYAFHDELIGQGLDEKRYNDIKESLTEILNLEYVDLMDGIVDEGYSQHVAMRKKVRALWLATKDLRKTVLGITTTDRV